MVRSRFYEEIDPSVVRTETGQVFDPNTDRFKSKASGPSYDKVDPFYYRKNLRESTQKPKPPTSKERRVIYEEEESGALAPGMTVEHHLFGEGKVLSMEGNGAQTKAVVFFKDAGQKKLILRFARLKRIG